MWLTPLRTELLHLLVRRALTENIRGLPAAVGRPLLDRPVVTRLVEHHAVLAIGGFNDRAISVFTVDDLVSHLLARCARGRWCSLLRRCLCRSNLLSGGRVEAYDCLIVGRL